MPCNVKSILRHQVACFTVFYIVIDILYYTCIKYAVMQCFMACMDISIQCCCLVSVVVQCCLGSMNDNNNVSVQQVSYFKVVDNSVDNLTILMVVRGLVVDKLQNHRAHFTQKIYMRSRTCVRIRQKPYKKYPFYTIPDHKK